MKTIETTLNIRRANERGHAGREDSATIHQDAEIYRIRLQPGQSVTHQLKPGRGAWLQVAEGALTLNGVALTTGDGASTETPGALTLVTTGPTEALLFDLGEPESKPQTT